MTTADVTLIRDIAKLTRRARELAGSGAGRDAWLDFYRFKVDVLRRVEIDNPHMGSASAVESARLALEEIEADPDWMPPSLAGLDPPEREQPGASIDLDAMATARAAAWHTRANIAERQLRSWLDAYAATESREIRLRLVNEDTRRALDQAKSDDEGEAHYQAMLRAASGT